MRAVAARGGGRGAGSASWRSAWPWRCWNSAWLSWFLSEPLPNSAPVGRPKLHRSDLLWRALPGVVPGVRLEQSLLGPALEDLSHVENLPQRVPIVLAAGLIAVAALALGDLTLRGLKLLRLLSPSERIALAFGLGTTGLGVVTLGLGRLGVLAPGRPGSGSACSCSPRRSCWSSTVEAVGIAVPSPAGEGARGRVRGPASAGPPRQH